MTNLDELVFRSNIMRRMWNDKNVFIYDDHRHVLNVLFALYKDGIKKPNLVFFDAHDDASKPRAKEKELLEMIGAKSLKEATNKQFGAFVDYDLRIDDSDWLLTACELNLINDALVIGNRCNQNIEDFSGIYKSEDGTNHNLYELSSNLSYEFGDRGKIGDVCRE